MHYELKGRHEVCYKAKIGLTGQVNMHSTYRNWCFWNKKATPGFLLTQAFEQLYAAQHERTT